MTNVAFGAWLPDLPALNNPGLLTAENVMPINKAYKPFYGLATTATALAEAPLGAIGTKDSSGNAFVFVGTSSKLYRLTSSANVDVSKGGGYTTGSELWFFSNFGNNLIATNYSDAPQLYDLTGSGSFADLAASAPKARYIAVCNEFVLLANVNDSVDGVVKHRVWWSPIGDPAGTWTASQTTQCDYDDIPDAGEITGMIGYQDFVYILMERGIYRMTYEGTPLIFRSSNIANVPGCEVPKSIVQYNNLIFYYGAGAFWKFDGVSSENISVNKISKWFIEDFDASKKNCVSTVVDEKNGIIMWAYAGDGNTGSANRILIYNMIEGRWSVANIDGCCLFGSQKLGTLLDEISGSLDALSGSLDSSTYAGGGKQIAMFDTSYRLSTFSGNAETAVLETGEIEPIERKLSYVEVITPLVDGTSSVTVEVAIRDLQSATSTYGDAVSLNTNGEAEIYKTGRYHKYKFTIDDTDWDSTIGYQFNPVIDAEQ